MSSNLIARSNFPDIQAWVRRVAAAVGCALFAASSAQAAWVPLDFPRRDVTLRAAAIDGSRIAVSGSKGTFGVSDDAPATVPRGAQGSAVSRDLGRTWRPVDAVAFHAIACAPVRKRAAGRCVAAGANGRVALWRD